MEHFRLGDSRPDSTSGSNYSTDSFVWPNFGSIDASPANPSSDHGPLPPPIPPRRVRTSTDGRPSLNEHQDLPTVSGQHDGQEEGVLTPVAGSLSSQPLTQDTQDQQPWTAAGKMEAVAATQQELWATTLPRRVLIVLCCLMCLVSIVFLIVAHSGSTRASTTSMNIYFFRMDLSYLFANQTQTQPASAVPAAPNPALESAIAQSIGLHDYYQAGLWGFCQGFYGSGLSSCSPPLPFYWFNPLGIVLDELLLQSTLDIPPRLQTVLDVVRVLSQVMFGLYFVGAMLAFVLLLASPLVLFSRWFSLPVAVLAGITAAQLVVASSIATFLAVAYRVVAASITQLHVAVTMGPAMFVMVWAATGLSVGTFLAHATLGCCATSVRDVQTGYRPYVRLPRPVPAQSDEAGSAKKAGFVSLVSWPSVLKKMKKSSTSPASTAARLSSPTISPPLRPPRPASPLCPSPLVLHPAVPSRPEDVELASYSGLAREHQQGY